MSKITHFTSLEFQRDKGNLILSNLHFTAEIMEAWGVSGVEVGVLV